MIPGSLDTTDARFETDHPAKFEARNIGAQTQPWILSEILRVLSIWRARARARAGHRCTLASLSGLDDHILCDIGVDRGDLRRQASKPFWRA